MQISVLNQ